MTERIIQMNDDSRTVINLEAIEAINNVDSYFGSGAWFKIILRSGVSQLDYTDERPSVFPTGRPLYPKLPTDPLIPFFKKNFLRKIHRFKREVKEIRRLEIKEEGQWESFVDSVQTDHRRLVEQYVNYMNNAQR